SYGRYRSGVVRIDGREVSLPTVLSAIENRIAYVPEDRKALGLNLLDSILGTIQAANLPRIAKAGVIDQDAAFVAAESYRKAFSIKAPSVHEGVAKLSGGNQQKVLLAKWMYTEPELLILDEPTRGIDVGAKRAVYDLMRELTASGVAVLFISSELPEVVAMADRVLVMRDGRLAGELPAGSDEETVMALATGAGEDTSGEHVQVDLEALADADDLPGAEPATTPDGPPASAQHPTDGPQEDR
ncbi:ATP-binding cassette domain-containing protein, partial [Streptomyces sp. SID13726]|uniref:ATP-binding cassette domain-containing protein n=1 Tax=Streptomyces sp. SID13726 TaxID=2706058 RepID=UPI0013B5EC55